MPESTILVLFCYFMMEFYFFKKKNALSHERNDYLEHFRRIWKENNEKNSELWRFENALNLVREFI